MDAVLGPGQTTVVNRVCELLVPGSSAVRPHEYLAATLPSLSPAQENEVHAAIGLMADVTGETALAGVAGSAAFDRLRRLAIEAFYGDFAPEGHSGPTGHERIGFAPPQASRLRKDWSFLAEPVPARGPWDACDASGPDGADVLVIGSGAGGVIAAELADRGIDVMLVEAGGFEPAAGYMRFELAARHRLWWPTRLASTGSTSDEAGAPIALLAGRCVGGSTVINTKVAMRAPAADIEKFHATTGLLGDRGHPFGVEDLEPFYDRISHRLGVRERSDWSGSVRRVEQGFTALGASLKPVRSYTDHNCSRCGSCLQGCPTNAGKSTLNTFLTPALGTGSLRLRTRHTIQRVMVDRTGRRPRVTGVRYQCDDGGEGVLRAPVVVLAAGSLNTPQILLRSEEIAGLDTPSTRRIGRTLGLHPARLVYGLFDEPQDCHRVYPITAHCLDHQADAEGGFVVEATTIQDPVSFAESLVDEHDRPLWGARLAEAVDRYRYWAGLLVMATDENTATIHLGTNEDVVVHKRFSTSERQRLGDALQFGVAVLRAAGAREVLWTGLSTTHMQGSAPMGDDPARSVVNSHGAAHDVDGLYVGDGSLVPASLSVNPSLTIMALAAKVAGHVAEEFHR